MSSPSVREHANAPILTKRSMDAFRDHYVRPGHDVRDPLLSPLFGRLDGLPPALVQTADLDPIRDDGIRYADALRAAGVPVRLTNYLRVPHGFASMPGAAPAVGRQQRWELANELRTALAPSP
jgi:acetyl esterase